MSTILQNSETRIYVYDSQFHEKNSVRDDKKDILYSVHPTNTAENINRLNDFWVDPSRVIRITDNSYLKRELATQEKSILIIGGGYTYYLSKELESINSQLKTSVHKGLLNIWGQCSGGNILCESMTIPNKTQSQNNFGIQQLNILPLVAHAAVYPIQKSEKYGDDINRKISTLRNQSNDFFTSFWYRGSQYTYSDNVSVMQVERLSPLAYYADLSEKMKLLEKPLAVVHGTNKAGSHVIASGIHTEITDVEIPYIDSVHKKLTSDKNRKMHLECIYKTLGVLPIIDSKL